MTIPFLNIHTLFDLLALMTAIGAGTLLYRWRLQNPLEKTAASVGRGYFPALAAGSITGAYLFGTANLWLSGEQIVGRSILGSLAGAILTVELYKLHRGARGSTGYIYAVPFALLVAVGRLGCFFSGLGDHTYGVATTLPGAVDFGDGIPRHPVQLYESLSLLAFALFAVMALKFRPQFFVNYGFYLCTGFYAAQRFLWEFLKPYATVAGGMNIFHFVCLALVAYSLVMILKVRHGYRIA
jgi:phosphatidylglycerol:prolipoprotein diacylglycerol transferase